MNQNINWQAHIQIKDALRRFAEVTIFQWSGNGNGITILQPDGTKFFTEDVSQYNDEIKSWRMPVEVLPALLGALSSHLGAVEHPQQLRRDYEEERKRVDKLTDTVITIARGKSEL